MHQKVDYYKKRLEEDIESFLKFKNDFDNNKSSGNKMLDASEKLAVSLLKWGNGSIMQEHKNSTFKPE